MKLTKKQKKELMIGGAIVLVGGIGIYLYMKNSASTSTTTSTSSPATVPATTDTTQSTTPIASVPAQTPAAPTGIVNINFTNIEYTPAQYSVQLYLSIINNTSAGISLTQIVGAGYFSNIPAALVPNEPPMFDGKVGNVNWPLWDGTPYDVAQTIQPGSSYTRWFPVEVQETAVPKFALQAMAYQQQNNPGLNPFLFTGYAVINGESLNFNLTYKF